VKDLYFKFLSKFYKPFSVKANSALLIEFRSFHGETLPGYIKYLLDLEYSVDVVLPKSKKANGGDRNDGGLFSCFSTNSKVRVFFLSIHDINILSRSSIIFDYRHIVMNTFNDKIERDYLSSVNLSRLKPVCVIHNPDIVNAYSQNIKMVSLVKMVSANQKSPLIVNPHYFGNFEKKTTKNNESNMANFVTLNSKSLSRRNLNLLFQACDALYKRGIYNFSVKVIGKGIPIPDCYHSNIQDLGFQDFQQMYKEINGADFFLALIDQESIQYANKASGTYQISYGFLKPLLLHRIFSEVSGFNNENSILYDDNNALADAMEKCINIPNDTYCNIVDALEVSQKNLYNMSLNNLKKLLEDQAIEPPNPLR